MPKVQADGLPLPQRYGAILTIVIGISMAVLDGAIANVALPTIATDLHATPASSIWVVNAYQIAIVGNDSNLLIVFYVQIMPDDFVMQLHRF